jgi:hypothetical protein
LKRVFKIDIETCDRCGGAVKIIADRIEVRAAGHGWPVCGFACIEDPAVIKKILTHLNKKEDSAKPAPLPESRAPPQAVLFDAP